MVESEEGAAAAAPGNRITAGPGASSPPPASWPIWRGPLALILISGLLELGGAPLRALLRYERVAILEQGEIWRLLTGSLVHLGLYHWFLNALGLVVLALLCPEPLRWAEWWRRWLFLSLAMALGLLIAEPGLDNYVGMSGAIHGLFLLGLLPQARRGDLIAIGCLVFLAGKLAWEWVAGAPVSDAEAIGGYVVTESHAFGGLAALAYALIFRTVAAPQHRTPPPA
ncbi:MAG TPA: rhombosortase [Nevskiaceae bacterium]|nr:rhombosortase [Nevskiaceae bacterium]